MKQFSPNAILALKEALTHIYWKKQDLRSFVYHAVENKLLISTIQSKSPLLKTMLLMDGEDMMAVQENRIDLKDLLFRKRRHASESGDIFLRFREMQ